MNLQQILTFLHYSENIKKELRHSWLSDGRQESVAEHAWRVSLMAILLSPLLNQKIDLLKVLKMIIIHDINEATVGDVPAFDKVNHAQQKIDEQQNILVLKEKFKSDSMDEIVDLWQEFEKMESYESKFVKALDKIEVRIQHNEADINTWSDIEFARSLFAADKYCEFDNVIKEFNELVKNDSRMKISNESNKDLASVENEAQQLKLGI